MRSRGELVDTEFLRACPYCSQEQAPRGLDTYNASRQTGGRGREPSGLLGYPTATFWATIWRLRRMARTSTGCWTRRRRGGRPSVGPKLEAVAAATMPGGAIRPVKARSPRVNSVRKVAKKATGGRAKMPLSGSMSEPSLDSIRWRRSDGRTDATSGPTSRPGHRQDCAEQECRSARHAQQRAGKHRGERHRDRHPQMTSWGTTGWGMLRSFVGNSNTDGEVWLRIAGRPTFRPAAVDGRAAAPRRRDRNQHWRTPRKLPADPHPPGLVDALGHLIGPRS
jgi:hypothetical protein